MIGAWQVDIDEFCLPGDMGDIDQLLDSLPYAGGRTALKFLEPLDRRIVQLPERACARLRLTRETLK